MEYYHNIRQNRGIHIVGRHFNTPGHNSLDNLNIYVLDFLRVLPDSAQAAKLRDEIEKSGSTEITSSPRSELI